MRRRDWRGCCTKVDINPKERVYHSKDIGNSAKLREDTLCGEKESSKNVSDKVAFKTEVEKVDIAKHMPTIVDPKRS